MSPRNWGHGQTFIGGAIAGLALAQRPLWIFAAGVIVGAAIVLLARFARRAGELVVDYFRGRGRRIGAGWEKRA
jgi:thiamine pyrophosphate-dependent acetolactate synthase large subunit-like protein